MRAAIRACLSMTIVESPLGVISAQFEAQMSFLRRSVASSARRRLLNYAIAVLVDREVSLIVQQLCMKGKAGLKPNRRACPGTFRAIFDCLSIVSALSGRGALSEPDWSRPRLQAAWR